MAQRSSFVVFCADQQRADTLMVLLPGHTVYHAGGENVRRNGRLAVAITYPSSRRRRDSATE